MVSCTSATARPSRGVSFARNRVGPKPRKYGMMVRKPAAFSFGATLFHVRRSSGQPCKRKMTGPCRGPSARSETSRREVLMARMLGTSNIRAGKRRKRSRHQFYGDPLSKGIVYFRQQVGSADQFIDHRRRSIRTHPCRILEIVTGLPFGAKLSRTFYFHRRDGDIPFASFPVKVVAKTGGQRAQQ